MAQTTDLYRHNPLIHRDRNLGAATSEWVRSFACTELKPLIVCRGLDAGARLAHRTQQTPDAMAIYCFPFTA